MTREPLVARLEALALVGIGGFAGSNLRFFVDGIVPGLGATLLVNVLGSVVLGFVLYEAIHAGNLAVETRAVVATGFLSSFTTYSTFALQSAGAALWLLAANVLANYALGFGGVLVGRRLALRTGDGAATAGASATDERDEDREVSQ